jgi:hypothetical protein
MAYRNKNSGRTRDDRYFQLRGRWRVLVQHWSDCWAARSSERRGPRSQSGRVRAQSCFFNSSMWVCNSSQLAMPIK